ncbi:MAG: hypothetical protein ACI4RD_03485 [Kiritimatiellia bacterium]
MNITQSFFSPLLAAAVALLAASGSVAAPAKTPPALTAGGCYVFLAVTGRPTDAELSARVALLAQGGVDGLVIYARDGLEYEYLGEEWLHACETLCAEAKRQRLKIWLYDEFAWPSGRCHGRVGRENEAFRYAELTVSRAADGSFRWQERRGDEGTVNVLEPVAVERFVELTHRVYARRLRPYLDDGTILGIFTDEPGHSVWMRYAQEPLARIRTWSTLEGDYRARTGRGFRADVEAFLLAGGADGTARVWEDYAALQGRQFRRAFLDPVAREAAKMGIVSTGHLIGEEMPREAVYLNGDPLAALAGLTLPGIDEVFGIANTRDVCYHSKAPLELTTYAMVQHESLRRGGAMAELFALGPAEMPASHLRQLVWLGALHGVSHFLCSLDSLDMSGLYTRRIYLAPITTCQPWWEKYMPLVAGEMRAASARARRRDGEFHAAVRYPQRLAARSAHPSGRSKTVREPDLMGFLHRFQLTQIATRLIGEEEPSPGTFVFAIEDGGTVREETSGTRFATAVEAADWVRARIRPALHLETADGTWADRLLLRNYGDGESIVVNLAHEQEARPLVAVTAHGRRAVELPPRGVLHLRWDAPSAAAPAVRALGKVEGEYELTCDRPLTHRLAFATNGTARIVCRQALAGVRFAVLDRPEVVGVRLDGEPLATVRRAKGLPRNYDVHYRETAPLALGEGVHEVRLPPGVADDNFLLPRVVLVGDFAAVGETVCARPAQVQAQPLAAIGLDGLAGETVYAIDAEVPAVGAGETLELALDTGDAFTEVRLGGRSLGRRAWAPFVWTVPREFGGTRQRLEIAVTASVTAFWGALDVPGTEWQLRPPGSWWGIRPRDPSRRIGLGAAPVWQARPVIGQ